MSNATGFSLTSPCMQQSSGVVNTMVSGLLQTILAAQCAISPPELWPKDYGPTSLNKGLGTYDFVVIGAGTAGSVMASRLSENPNNKVLVLEAGGDPPQESLIPSLHLSLHHNKYNWNYFTEPDGKSCRGSKNLACYLPRGKMIGGSGAINGMLYIRGISQDFDDWERKGNPHWAWHDVLPFFEKSVRLGKDDSDCKGGVTVSPSGVNFPEIGEMLFEAASELGIPKIEALEEGADIGYVSLQGNVENGRRRSTGQDYLAEFKDRPNLHVIKHAVATKINFDATGQKATGVTFNYLDNYKMTVNIAKEVILSAGSIDSPKLLMLSGIGPKNHLNKFGIPLVKELRVGDNLQDHMITPLFFKLNTSKVKRHTMKDQLDAAYEYLTNRTGPMSYHSTAAVTGLINSDKSTNSPYPDIIFMHSFAQSGTTGVNLWVNAIGLLDSIAQGIRNTNAEYHILIVYILLLRPKSIGTLRLRSADPKDPPKLFANYLEQEADINTFLRGIKFQMAMEQTDAFKEQDAKIIQIDLPECDQFPFKGNEYWKCYMKYMTGAGHHLAGTVKMGADTDWSAVVDWRLRLKGIQGLRVADASIMPDIVSANTNAATIMIAERAAEFVKEDWEEHNEEHCEL